MNLAQIVHDSAARTPAAAALKLDQDEVSYAELERSIARLAGLLRRSGVQPGDRVAVMIPNAIEFPICYYGVLWSGAVVVPVNVLFKQRELEFLLDDCDAKQLLVWDGFTEHAVCAAQALGRAYTVIEPDGFARQLESVDPPPAMVQREADDTAVIIYTSGTTGRPKGAELTHANVLSNAQTVAPLFGLHAGSRLLCALPMFHAFGATSALHTAMISGTRLTVMRRFDPALALALVKRDQIEVFLGVPTMYSEILNVPDKDPADAASLQLCVGGGASLPSEVVRRFEATFGAEIRDGYGLSEASPVCTFNLSGPARKLGSVGPPIPGVQMRIFDDHDRELPARELGEVVVRGPNVMKGYRGLPEATAAALRGGWLHTGDLGYADTDGYVFIVDRKCDVIIRGGQNIYPREVEEVLHEHPAVRDACVVAIPDEIYGENVGAAIVLRTGRHATGEELSHWVKDRLAAYKYPRTVWFVNDLPKGASGKILRREVAANRVAELNR